MFLIIAMFGRSYNYFKIFDYMSYIFLQNCFNILKDNIRFLEVEFTKNIIKNDKQILCTCAIYIAIQLSLKRQEKRFKGMC